MQNRRIRFSGHQTFTLRYGWVEKGYEFAGFGKRFSEESAIVDLGVGKNMVESIRYWCEMTGIIGDDRVSEFGQHLLDEQTGWDPYLEDLASWWLLHWRMITNPKYKTSGTALFSNLRKPDFSKNDLAEAALRLVDEGKKAPTDNIIMRDVDCYVRSYCSQKRFEKKKSRDDDPFDCPFQELDLIQPMSEGDFYRFSIGPKASLPSEIIGYAISQFFGQENKNAMTIQKILYQEGSPGQVFMLDENALIEAVQDLQESAMWGARFGFTESAGLAHVSCTVELDESTDLLNSYYNRGDV